MTWELLAALITMIAAACGIVFGARSNSRAADELVRKDAMALARIEEKLDSVSRCVNEMHIEVRTHGGQIADLTTRIARNEESIRSAHKRIDKLDDGWKEMSE